MKVARSLVAAVIVGITLFVAACGSTGSLGRGGTVTVYSADGLGAWYFSQFYKFTQLTGIKVNLVEAGSGEVVSRVEKGTCPHVLDTLNPGMFLGEAR